MSADLKEFEEEWQIHKKRFMENLITLSEPVPVYFEGKERDELLKKMKEVMKSTCELDIMYDEMIRTAKKVENSKKKAESEGSPEISSVKKMYEALMSEEGSKRQNPAKHQMYIRLEKNIKNSMKKVTEKDDLVVTEAEINIIDPITMTVLENPVRNKLCKHVYSKKSIHALLKKPKHFKCPVVGCPVKSTFTFDDLESDHELEEYIKKVKSRNAKKP